MSQQLQLPIAQWQQRASQLSSSGATGGGSQQQQDEEDCIDLTDERTTTIAQANQAAPAAAASSSQQTPNSSQASIQSALTPKQLMQAALTQGGGGSELRSPPRAPASASSASSSAAAAAASKKMLPSGGSGGSSGSGSHLLASSSSSFAAHSTRAPPKLQLSTVSYTPSDADAAAASAAAAAAASTHHTAAAASSSATVAPLRGLLGSSVHSSASHSNGSRDSGAPPKLSHLIVAAQQRNSTSTAAAAASSSTSSSSSGFMPPAPFSRAAAAAAPPVSASKYAAKREPVATSVASATADSFAAPLPYATGAFALTPPASNKNNGAQSSNGHPVRAAAPQSAPSMRRTSAAPAAAAAAASSSSSASASSRQPQQSLQPLRNASGAQYEESEDEALVRRNGEVNERIHEFEDQILGIQAQIRELKNEQRAIQERLNRPMQLPFGAGSNSGARPAAAVSAGGASALISGSAFWNGRFPWDSEALEALSNVFGLSGYRVSQREVINATMSRKDTFVIMPTGAGKSLLYQLPAVLNEGVTLVISPLLSLMEDQLIYLRNVGVESYMLCGTTSREELSRVHAHMLDKHSKMRLLYVTPEKIAKSKQFLAKLERMYEMGKLVRIVIDEVHCCSQWGHDFRPDYKKLNVLKIQFPDVPILAVTATATEKVARDCQQILKIQGCQQFKCSFNRPNLHFSVRNKSGTGTAVAQDMYDFIKSIGHINSSGIVYCYSKKETMEVCSQLSALGISCDFYNSDVAPEVRQRVHHRWVKNQIKVVVATNAFGLGINKPDVRFVLHHTIPQGIETMYQEAGRAGRDGLKAYCCIWYSPRDLTRQSTRVYAKQDMTGHLYPLISYCHQLDQCRRTLMARYFGEQIRPSQCNRMCDVCEFMGAAEDAETAAAAANGSTAAAAAAGSSIQPHSSPFFMRDLSEAAIQLCDWLSSHSAADTGAPARGKGKRRRMSATAGGITQKGVVDECRKKTSTIELPKGLTRDDVERFIIELMLQGVLKETFKNTAYTTNSYLQVEPTLARSLRSGDFLLKLKFVDTKKAKHAEDGGTPPRKRASTKGKTKSEKGAAASSSSSTSAAAASSRSRLDDDDADDFDLDDGAPDEEAVDESQYELELDEDFQQHLAATRGDGGGANHRSDDDDDDFDLGDGDPSEEDQPIKKTKREPVSSRIAPQQPRGAPRAAAAAAGKQVKHQQQHDLTDEFDLPDEEDEEAVYQRMLRQSVHDF